MSFDEPLIFTNIQGGMSEKELGSILLLNKDNTFIIEYMVHVVIRENV